MDTQSPFHAAERAVQARLGVGDIEDWARKVVRPSLPAEHRTFYAGLPFLVVAARDPAGRPWSTLLAGPCGFASSPTPRSLVVGARPTPGDALDGALLPGADIGILGIELATRRRNRVNGRLDAGADGALHLAVAQSFGNCPQHVRERAWRWVDDEPPGRAISGARLTPAQRSWITRADTFFIASGHRGTGEHPAFGMDASHRGGERGFVRVESESRLVFPDYAGNNHFNTIGNLVADPRAGLLFVDFESGSLLQLTGRATIDWASPAVASVAGARRLVAFDIDAIVELPHAVPLRWESDATSVRSLRLVEKTPESADVTSFVFTARDGGALPAFEAGQHLPIELEIPGVDAPVRRSYSLSGAPQRAAYRITVKRTPMGTASRYLHDHLAPGAIIEARRPAGSFVLPPGDDPIVLVSAGVGLTPMVSMLHALAAAPAADRPVWFVHGARDGAHHPLAGEVAALVAAHANMRSHIAYSRPRPADRLGTDYDLRGRIDGARLVQAVRDPMARYFLCGPVGFMAEMHAALEAHGAPAERVHSESFGPAG